MCSIPRAYSVALYASYSKIPDSSPRWYRTARSAVLLGLANETMFLSISSLSRIGLQSLPKGKHERSPTAFLHDGLSRYATLTPSPLQAFSPATRASNDTTLSGLLVVANRSLRWIRTLAVHSLSLLAEVPPDANRRSPRDPRLGAFRGTEAIWLSKGQK